MKDTLHRFGICILVALALTTTPASAATTPSPETGLIIDAIMADSPAERVGLKVGDRLLTYNDRPLPSFPALEAAQQNMVGKNDVALRVRRGNEVLDMTVPLGPLGIEVRTDLSPPVLALYRKGSTAAREKRSNEMLSNWSQAAKAALEGGDKMAAMTLLYRIGRIYELEGGWKEAQESYTAAWELAEGGDDPAAQAQILTALGRCSYQSKDYLRGTQHYEQAVQVSVGAGNELWAAVYLVDMNFAATGGGDYQAAHAYLERALKIRERLTPDTLEHALVLNQLGGVSVELLDLKAARGYYEQARKIRERLVPNSLQLAYTLNGLGKVALKENDLKAARDYCERALRIRELLASGSRDEGYSLSTLGEIALEEGNPQAAQKYFERLLPIYERLGVDLLSIAYVVEDLGTIAFELGKLQSAQKHYQRVLEIREKLAPESLGVVSVLHHLGELASSRGDLKAAQENCVRARDIAKRVAPESYAMATSLNCLGGIAISHGDLELAQTYYQQSLELSKKLPAGPRATNAVHTGYNNLGNVAYMRGDLQAAYIYHGQSLKIAEQEGKGMQQVAFSLTGLGYVLEAQGDLQTAQKHYQRALEIREKLVPESLLVASSLHNLGSNAIKRRDFKAAQTYLKRALRLREQLSPGSPAVGLIQFNLSLVSLLERDRQAARKHLDSALAIYEKVAPGSLEMANFLLIFGNMNLTDGRLTEARDILTQAVEIIEAQRGKIPSIEARAFLLGKSSLPFDVLLDTHLALNDRAAAFATVERAHARSLVDLLSQRRLNIQEDVPAELKSRQNELEEKRSRTYFKLIKLDPDKDKREVAELRKELATYSVEQRELAGQIRATSPKSAALKYAQPLDLKGARDALDAGTLLLTYYVEDDKTYLFAVTKTDNEVYTLPVGEKALNDMVVAFRNSVSIKRPGLNDALGLKDANGQGKKLYDVLIGPAQVYISRAERILICPDGPLHILPFATLVSSTEPTLRYFIEDKPLHTIVSMTVYAELQNAKAGKNRRPNLLAFGDPATMHRQPKPAEGKRLASAKSKCESEVGARGRPNPTSAPLDVRSLDLGPLPCARKEVEAISKLFRNSATVKLGPEATETAAKKASSGYSILHFAVHGWFDEQTGLDSGLILSPPEILGREPTKDDNGLWQAWEILEHLRLDADLVVLPACETGLGQKIRGEGIIGLTRAFQYAGAKSIVVSLWEVNDSSTSVLMTTFYRELRKGVSKDVALQRAIRVVRGNPKSRHPFYWSPFILVGAWR